MKQIDYYIEAVNSWQQANRNLKHFAECCWHVSGSATKALAADCKCSDDTIENYRNAYALYLELGESERVRMAWDSATIALWVKAAQLRTRLELQPDKAFDYLETANREGMTREQMAAHVDEKENHVPKWIRRLRSAIRFLKPSKDDYKSELPREVRDRYDKAVDWFVNELQEIADFQLSAPGTIKS